MVFNCNLYLEFTVNTTLLFLRTYGTGIVFLNMVSYFYRYNNNAKALMPTYFVKKIRNPTFAQLS